MGYLDRSTRAKNRGRETSVLQHSQLKHSQSAGPTGNINIGTNGSNYNYREQPPLDLPAIPALVPTNLRDRTKPKSVPKSHRSRVVSALSRTPMKMASAPVPRARTCGSDGVFLYVQVRVHNVIQRLLVPRMLAQVRVCDRSFLLRKYRRCFVGNEACAWLISRRFARTIREAEALGNALLQAGVFRHVRNEHRFRAGNYFYRFAAHENYASSEDDLHGNGNSNNSVAGLRSSRLMSVATRNTTTAAHYRDTTFSEDDFSIVTRIDSGTTDSYNSNTSQDDRLSFTEKNVAVDVGIRIGHRMYPDLVSRFSAAVDGIGKFTGRYAAEWLIEQGYTRNVEDAMAVGNAMIKAGVFFPGDNSDSNVGDGFDADQYYRLSVDVDFSAEFRRGEMKDNILKWFGIDRSKGTESLEDTNAPWFEDSLSFTTNSSYGY